MNKFLAKEILIVALIAVLSLSVYGVITLFVYLNLKDCDSKTEQLIKECEPYKEIVNQNEYIKRQQKLFFDVMNEVDYSGSNKKYNSTSNSACIEYEHCCENIHIRSNNTSIEIIDYSSGKIPVGYSDAQGTIEYLERATQTDNKQKEIASFQNIIDCNKPDCKKYKFLCEQEIKEIQEQKLKRNKRLKSFTFLNKTENCENLWLELDYLYNNNLLKSMYIEVWDKEVIISLNKIKINTYDSLEKFVKEYKQYHKIPEELNKCINLDSRLNTIWNKKMYYLGSDLDSIIPLYFFISLLIIFYPIRIVFWAYKTYYN